MKRLKPTDVVVIGSGWSGLVMAKEVTRRTALQVIVLERGPARNISQYADGMDEINTRRVGLLQNPADQTITHRHSVKDRAAPIRQYGAFTPGTGTGGTSEHWGGIADRYLPDFFSLSSHLREKFGPSRMSPDWTIQDWGITYDEFENDYWRAEQLMGISGKAGNLRGQLQEGGNIFEGPRQHEYPTPPLTPTYTMGFFHKAATQLGYHPFPLPAANLSRAYTNPDNVSRPGCVFCGYCPTHGCMIGAKAQPTNTIMPVLSSRNNFLLRNNCWVRKIVHGNGKAEGVMYMDENGEETFQPAEVVVLSAWTPNSVRLLLLSDIGEKYDPVTAKGTLGKNLTHQVTSGASGMLVFKERLNLFMGSGAVGYGIADLDGDIKQEMPEKILRGGAFLRGAATGEGPAGSFGRIPKTAAPRNWGTAWKKAAIEHWDRIGPGVEMRGDHFAYRQNFMDLDPTYTDKWGDPLLRMTLDWTGYEMSQMAFGARVATQILETIAQVSGATVVKVERPAAFHHYNAAQYSTTHIQGGAIMGASPEQSVVNPWLQHWQMPNLFVVGSSSFPQNSSANPTLTIVAVSHRAADGLIDRYLKKPGPLA
ncbi:MAG: gluconate 2-dehydrogenase alpha chain [Acidobacteriaceae bacterium]|nr:gluconate 2-dehydrogenase alpha chain [Acidobacteriaceae bacterium]